MSLNRLLYKIECLGIKGKVLDIIRDFLTGRSFRVCVGGEFSNLNDVLSGIPQGSVLGPLLFVLYINDLPDSIKSFAKLFADDLKMIAKASDKLIIIIIIIIDNYIVTRKKKIIKKFLKSRFNDRAMPVEKFSVNCEVVVQG